MEMVRDDFLTGLVLGFLFGAMILALAFWIAASVTWR
jgi:Mg/Co/Ni transporter MgtE